VVDGLCLNFENELLVTRQRWGANLTLGHEQAVVFNAQQSNSLRLPQVKYLHLYKCATERYQMYWALGVPALGFFALGISTFSAVQQFSIYN
jgi:hypothetical protein